MPSENGWNPSWVGEDSLQWVTIPGTSVSMQFMKGWPLQILRAFAADYNAFVEPLRDRDSASYTPTNSVSTSNHLNGTAMDLNWDSHPFHVKGTFSDSQMKTIRELLEYYEGTVFWAGDWTSPIDEMHWQMGYGTYGNPDVGDFINRKIQLTGFSGFRRTTKQAVDPVRVLANMMGNTLPYTRYAELFPAARRCLINSQCNTVKRIAMWASQVGHESGGLQWMSELADGSAYNNRADLGNGPTDGPRYRGRGPLQVTGRRNYTELSKWAFANGLVPTDSFFVDDPDELASDEYGFIGVEWYWTTQRPLNAAADAGDLELATRYVNGGLNGLDSRRTFYELALSFGNDLLALVADSGDSAVDEETIEGLLMSDKLYESVSLYKTPGEGPKYTLAQLIQSIDGFRHRETVEAAAALGSLEDIERIFRVAVGKGAYTDPVSVNHAKAFLSQLEKTNPDALKAYLVAKGISA